MSRAAAAAAAAAGGGGWRVIPRPLLETVLHNYAAHPLVPKPLLLHGPRGTGKTLVVRRRLLDRWNDGPHRTAYVDFAAALNPSASPWASWPSPAPLPALRALLERELELLAGHGLRLGAITAGHVFSALNRHHALHHALRLLAGPSKPSSSASASSPAAMWSRAVLAMSARMGPSGMETLVGPEDGVVKRSREEEAGVREGVAALGVAKEVVRMQGEWRREAVRELNRTGRASQPLAHSATDWPCLLLDVLSQASEIDFFQPKLVLNNVEVLRKAILTVDSSVPAATYHDSLIWRVIALGVNERCLPVILVTSDSYYSYQAFMDFGFPDIFLSRETFGWTPQEAKLHMVSDYFTESEWKVINEVLGPNPRHLCELYSLKQSTYYQQYMHDSNNSFEDLVDAYLAYLQVTVVNSAMESALTTLQKFASDVSDGKIPANRLSFGAPWRHPPCSSDPVVSLKWAKIHLMDFVQSLVNADFGLNYLADESLEILEDPSAVAMLEVGLLYKQRDPSFIRPISRGIQRCLIRWLVHEKMQMSPQEYMLYLWQRIIRGRSYRHLMKEIGYK